MLGGQSKPVADTVRTIEVAGATCKCWRTEFGGLKLGQVKLLKQENGRLRRVVADLMLEKLVLKEAAAGNF